MVPYLYFALSGLFNAVVSTILGLFIYFKDRETKANRAFALFCFCVAAWSYAYYFWPLAEDKESVLFWFRALHLGPVFASVAYLHFVAYWLNLYQKIKKIIFLGYFLATGFALSVFSPLFIKDVVPKFSMKYWAEPGILYHFYLLLFFGFMIYSSYLLIANYRKVTGIKRSQIKCILIGMTLAYIGGSTNYFLFYDINLPPYGNILASAYVIFTAYAIGRRQLFGIKVVLTQLLVAVMGVILLILPFLIKTTFLMKTLMMGVFLIYCFIGYLLVRSTLREAGQKEILEQRVRKRTKELEMAKNTSEERTREIEKRKTDLEKFYKLTVGRELRMIELKQRIKELEGELKEKE